jgi:hypothetical protein
VAPNASSVSPIPAARSETTWFWLRKEKQRVKQDRAAAPVLCSKPVSESNRSGEAASSRSSSCQSRRRRRGPPDRTRGYGHCCRCHASTAARLLYLTRSHLTRGEERTQRNATEPRACMHVLLDFRFHSHERSEKKISHALAFVSWIRRCSVLDSVCCLLHSYWLDRSGMTVGAGENADQTKSMHLKVIQGNLELASLRSCSCY